MFNEKKVNIIWKHFSPTPTIWSHSYFKEASYFLKVHMKVPYLQLQLYWCILMPIGNRWNNNLNLKIKNQVLKWAIYNKHFTFNFQKVNLLNSVQYSNAIHGTTVPTLLHLYFYVTCCFDVKIKMKTKSIGTLIKAGLLLWYQSFSVGRTLLAGWTYLKVIPIYGHLLQASGTACP